MSQQPVRSTFLSYCLPKIGDEEIAEVVDSLRSGWVTTGPKVKQFEADFAEYVGSKYAIAVGSCTAALHLALAALGIGPGDEVIVPTLTFCATANVVVHLGATPVVVDVDEHRQISVEAVLKAITPRTKAIEPVHFAGQACDLDEILAIANRRNIPVVEDAAHAAGAEWHGKKIGSHGRVTAFSFYATKNMTTGEGGMATTNDEDLAKRMRTLSLHGMSKDAWKRYSAAGSWYYEVLEAGYKYNMTDVQASLGIHQLRRLDSFTRRRQEIARRYTAAFKDIPGFRLPVERPGRSHCYHLYVVQIVPEEAEMSRAEFIQRMTSENIGTSVHFVPLHRHPFYQERFGYRPDQFPVAEKLYEGLVSLPLYPGMTDSDVGDVITAVRRIAKRRVRHAQVAVSAMRQSG